MRPSVSGVFAAIGLLPAFFAARADEAQVSGSAVAQNAVADAIRRAKDTFQAPTEDELAAAKDKVVSARHALVKELSLEPDGVSTGAELGIDVLAEQLAQRQGDLERLETIERKLQLNRPGVKTAAFERLRAGLTRYLQLLRSSAGPQVHDEFGRRIGQLEQAWQAHAAAPSPETLVELHDAYEWLARHGQATEATGEVRRVVSHANHVMVVSAQFVDTALVRDVNQPISTEDTQDGTRISVRGEMKGKIHARLEPDPDKGAMRIHFRGIGDSKITARKGPVTVHARGDTRVEASEVLHISEKGFGTHSPQVTVRHSTTPYGVNVNMRCRLLRKVVGKLACRVAWKQKAKSDRQAAAKTRRQVDEQLRTQTNELVREANRSLEEFGLFSALGPNPSSKLRLATTPQQLRWWGHYASPLQFAAPTEPPAIAASDASVVLQLHESAVNNAERLLAGRTANEADFRELVFETAGLVPNDDETVAGREPATIQFAEREPLTMHFDGGLADVTMRLKGVRHGREVLDAPDCSVRATYRPQIGAAEIALVRESFAVEPANFDGADRVKEVLSHFLVAKATRKRTASGGLALAQKVRLGQLTLDGGWLTLVIVPRKESK
jgi:hypothetical protein